MRHLAFEPAWPIDTDGMQDWCREHAVPPAAQILSEPAERARRRDTAHE